MKRATLIQLLSVTLTFTVLAGCGNNSPVQPPTNRPTTPPTTPVTPPTTPPPTPPVIPTPPTTPTEPPATDVPYGGSWAWVVAFEDETTIFGGLAITQVEGEPVIFTQSGEGPYVECQQEGCPTEADGVGVIGMYTADDGSTYLSAAFFDAALGSGTRLVTTDDDNQLGTELQGQESFLGAGTYYGDDGSETKVGVGIVRVPEDSSSSTLQNAEAALQKELNKVLAARKGKLRQLDASKLGQL